MLSVKKVPQICLLGLQIDPYFCRSRGHMGQQSRPMIMKKQIHIQNFVIWHWRRANFKPNITFSLPVCIRTKRPGLSHFDKPYFRTLVLFCFREGSSQDKTHKFLESFWSSPADRCTYQKIKWYLIVPIISMVTLHFGLNYTNICYLMNWSLSAFSSGIVSKSFSDIVLQIFS